MVTLHFEINPKNGRVTIHPQLGDTVLQFNSRRHTTIRDLGEAFIKIAEKAEELLNE